MEKEAELIKKEADRLGIRNIELEKKERFYEFKNEFDSGANISIVNKVNQMYKFNKEELGNVTGMNRNELLKNIYDKIKNIYQTPNERGEIQIKEPESQPKEQQIQIKKSPKKQEIEQSIKILPKKQEIELTEEELEEKQKKKSERSKKYIKLDQEKTELEQVKKDLEIRKIETKVHYARPLHETGLFTEYPGPNLLSTASSLARRVLSLPIYPELTDLEVEYIIDQLLNCVS